MNFIVENEITLISWNLNHTFLKKFVLNISFTSSIQYSIQSNFSALLMSLNKITPQIHEITNQYFDNTTENLKCQLRKKKFQEKSLKQIELENF